MVGHSEEKKNRLNAYTEGRGIQVFFSVLQIASNYNSRFSLGVLPIRVELVTEDEVERQLLSARSARLEGTCVGDKRRDLAADGVLNWLGTIILRDFSDRQVEDLLFVAQ